MSRHRNALTLAVALATLTTTAARAVEPSSSATTCSPRGEIVPLSPKRAAALQEIRAAKSRPEAVKALHRYLRVAGLGPTKAKPDPRATRLALAALLADESRISRESRPYYQQIFAARDGRTLRALALKIQSAGSHTAWEQQFVASMREAATAVWLAQQAGDDNGPIHSESESDISLGDIAVGGGVGGPLRGAIGGAVPGAAAGAALGAALGVLVVIVSADEKEDTSGEKSPPSSGFWDKGCPPGVIC